MGVRAQQANSAYTLLNWGPNLPQADAFFSYTDLALNRAAQTYTLSQPYRLFRYFHYGPVRDV